MGLSFVVAVFSSHAALDLGARLRAAQPRARAVWLPAAAIAVPVRTTKMPA
jgi:NO-binding membrane sensor protein with MHYT domain